MLNAEMGDCVKPVPGAVNSLLAVSGEGETSNGWPEIWYKFVQDCAEREKQRLYLKQQSRRNAVKSNLNAQRGKKQPQIYTMNDFQLGKIRQLMRTTKMPGWFWTKMRKKVTKRYLLNLYIDFVHKPNTNCFETFNDNDQERIDESSNTPNVYTCFVYKPKAPTSIDGMPNENSDISAINHVMNGIKKLDYEITVTSSNIVDLNNISPSHISRKAEANSKVDTTSSNYLWNLYLDFVQKPYGDIVPDKYVNENSMQLECVAIDCEMVEACGTGRKGRRNMLARVSVVDRNTNVLLDKFVKPTAPVTDYRTSISGIRPQDIENGEDFQLVRNEVTELIKGKIVVGHCLSHDLKALNIEHPNIFTRDTALYWPLRRYGRKGGNPSLKRLYSGIFGYEIQSGEHDSVEDAKAIMEIYNILSTNNGSSNRL